MCAGAIQLIGDFVSAKWCLPGKTGIKVILAVHYRTRVPGPGTGTHGVSMGGMCMRFLRSWLLTAVALLAVAAGATAQTTNGTITGHVADAQGLALPGVTVNASFTESAGHSQHRHIRERRLRAVRLAVGDIHTVLRVERVRKQQKDGRARADADAARRRADGCGGLERNRQRQRHDGRCADADRSGGDEFQAGPDPDTADQP